MDKGHQIKMVISDAGRTVLKVEESVDLTGNNYLDTKSLITYSSTITLSLISLFDSLSNKTFLLGGNIKTVSYTHLPLPTNREV